MIKLNDVSTERLMFDLEYRDAMNRGANPKINELYSLLQKLDVTTYGDIKEVQNLLSMLDYRLASINDIVNHTNAKGKEPKLYTFDTFAKYGVDDETVSKTDNKNRINDLLINNPARGWFEKKNGNVNRMWSIAQIKFLLGHLDEWSMENAFMTKARGFGEVKTGRLVNAINLYDKQLAKQYKETGKRSRGKNLLYVDWDEKSDIVLDNLYQMAECLVDSGDNFIWGELTDQDKLRIMEAVKNMTADENEAIVCNLIKMFTSYSTLNELKQGPTKPKTLRKYIVK